MPWNRNDYPSDWEAISRFVRFERAGNQCEGSPAYPDCRAPNHQPHPVTGKKVVLTVAHLNHDTTDCRDDNLRALCQRCHNKHDAQMRSRRRRARERLHKRVGWEPGLFAGSKGFEVMTPRLMWNRGEPGFFWGMYYASVRSVGLRCGQERTAWKYWVGGKPGKWPADTLEEAKLHAEIDAGAWSADDT